MQLGAVGTAVVQQGPGKVAGTCVCMFQTTDPCACLPCGCRPLPTSGVTVALDSDEARLVEEANKRWGLGCGRSQCTYQPDSSACGSSGLQHPCGLATDAGPGNICLGDPKDFRRPGRTQCGSNQQGSLQRNHCCLSRLMKILLVLLANMSHSRALSASLHHHIVHTLRTRSNTPTNLALPGTPPC